MEKKNIYISYRLSDSFSGEISMLIKDLSREFGQHQIIVDLDFDFERSWEDQLRAESSKWDVVIVIIGPTWLNSRDSEGNIRIHSINDFVRLEIAQALRLSSIQVVPILIGEAKLLNQEELPSDIKSLSWLTSFRLNLETWQRDIEVLNRHLNHLKKMPIVSGDTEQPPKIFISHRHSDTQSDCRSLKTELSGVFGEENIFFDIESLMLGTRFGKVIEKTLAVSKIILVAIGPEWAGPKLQNGLPRLFDENDWVRKEVSKALNQSNTWVIPILMKNASLPKADDLPDDLKSLLEIHSFEISNTRWVYDVSRLISHLEKLIDMSPE
jgi:hypothetical protein